MRSSRLLLVVCSVLVSSCGSQRVPSSKAPPYYSTVTLGIGALTSSASEPVLSFRKLGSSDYLASVDGNYVRFVTSNFSVDNGSSQGLRNLVLRAYSPATQGLAGTTFVELKTVSGEPLPEVAAATALQPTHAMRPGFLTPSVDTSGASLNVYSREESLELQAAAIAAGVLHSGDKVLDYGFSVSTPGGVIPEAGSGTLAISYRLPVVSRATAPYFMEAAFLVTEESGPRVTRSLEEGADVTGVLERVRELPGARLVLLGSPSQAEIDAVEAAGHQVQVVGHALLSTGGTSMP